MIEWGSVSARVCTGVCVFSRNMYVCPFIRLCLCFARWEWVTFPVFMSAVHDLIYENMRVRVCVQLRHDGNLCLLASQLKSCSDERDSPWCRYPNTENLNQVDTLLAHPAPAPNHSWQSQMHPIGCWTVVQFLWPLPIVQSVRQRDTLCWEKRINFWNQLVANYNYFSFLSGRMS